MPKEISRTNTSYSCKFNFSSKTVIRFFFFVKHFDSASHRDRVSKSYNPFYATNNSTYPDPYEQINHPKRRRIYPENQTHPLPDYIPISSHYSY